MDLHGIVSPCIAAINPMISATLYKSTGYTTIRGGTRIPRYDVSTGSIQRQGMSEAAVRHMNELNIGGVLRKVYLRGAWASLIRVGSEGGDLFYFDAHMWLVVHVLEQWPDWVAVVVQQQTTGAPPAFSIVSSAGANGSIAPLGTTSVLMGASQTYTITPDTGHSISDVVVDGVSTGTMGSYTFSEVLTDHTISASFTSGSVYYTITASSDENGSVTPDGETSVLSGGSQLYTITPSDGYAVEDVLIDASSIGPASSFTFSGVTSDHTISASFVPYIPPQFDYYVTEDSSSAVSASKIFHQAGVTSPVYLWAGNSDTYWADAPNRFVNNSGHFVVSPNYVYISGTDSDTNLYSFWRRSVDASLGDPWELTSTEQDLTALGYTLIQLDQSDLRVGLDDTLHFMVYAGYPDTQDEFQYFTKTTSGNWTDPYGGAGFPVGIIKEASMRWAAPLRTVLMPKFLCKDLTNNTTPTGLGLPSDIATDSVYGFLSPSVGAFWCFGRIAETTTPAVWAWDGASWGTAFNYTLPSGWSGSPEFLAGAVLNDGSIFLILYSEISDDSDPARRYITLRFDGEAFTTALEVRSIQPLGNVLYYQGNPVSSLPNPWFGDLWLGDLEQLTDGNILHYSPPPPS